MIFSAAAKPGRGAQDQLPPSTVGPAGLLAFGISYCSVGKRELERVLFRASVCGQSHTPTFFFFFVK